MNKLIEPNGRPHIHCNRCRIDVVWPEGLSASDASKFATIARKDSIEGLSYAENVLKLTPREGKALVLHITKTQNVCNKCGKPVIERESVCSCRSANLNW